MSYAGGRERLEALAFDDPGLMKSATLDDFGIDVRDPTGSRRLIELCLRLPDESYFCDGVPRRLARALVEDRVAPRVYTERRRGFQGSRLRGGGSATRQRLHEEIDAIEESSDMAALFDISRMREFADRPESGAHGLLPLIRAVGVASFMRHIPCLAADIAR